MVVCYSSPSQVHCIPGIRHLSLVCLFGREENTGNNEERLSLLLLHSCEGGSGSRVSSVVVVDGLSVSVADSIADVVQDLAEAVYEIPERFSA